MLDRLVTTSIFLSLILNFASASDTYAEILSHEGSNPTNKVKELDLLIKADDVTIGGTLLIPSHRKTKSLVILNTGSGPQDRDETLDGFKIFKVIAEHLGSQGIASFRFDDRGVGESTGNFSISTLEDQSKDLENIMDFFKTHRKHVFKDFILFGHSQGGIVTANVAVGNQDVKNVILMGAPSVPLIDIVLYQIRQEYASAKIDRSIIEAEVSAHNRLMRAIKDNKNINKTLTEFKDSTKVALSALASLKNSEPVNITKIANDKTKEFELIYALPSLTSFLYHDTSKDYEKLQVPVLGLFGGKDLQVTIEQNKDRMENALLKSGTTYHFVTFDDANHYFQKAKTGLRDEYETLDKAFVDGFLSTVSNWILENNGA